MTRSPFEYSAWTWVCDRCGRTSGDTAAEQRHLPTPDEMRTRGWFIAKVWGDRCPECVKADESVADAPALLAAIRDVLAVADQLARLAARHPESETGQVEAAAAHEIRRAVTAHVDTTPKEN